MEIKRFTLNEWNRAAEEVHAYAFGELRPKEFNTFDFALMALRGGEPMAYCTCIEFDKDSVYMQHGGALPASHGTINTAKGYAMMIKYLKESYKNISTRISNKNVSMMKLALSVGLIPNGIDFIGGEIFITFSMRDGN